MVGNEVSYNGGIGDTESPLYLGTREYQVNGTCRANFFKGFMDDLVISGWDL